MLNLGVDWCPLKKRQRAIWDNHLTFEFAHSVQTILSMNNVILHCPAYDMIRHNRQVSLSFNNFLLFDIATIYNIHTYAVLDNACDVPNQASAV